ncbi:hypothetical protein [Patiriisocius marinus]|uniref:hypothetical protein n=1 Tax=Patiriisocius marinus TaxID=1397112 RepID=UPI00232B9E0D|nr:hypothetical protein [Patiriisocius marinus]
MIEYVSISVYDTTLPSVSATNILDQAERGSVRLTYAGGDDKFLPVMASTLSLSLEVSIEDSLQELNYDYLFTGNEVRYSVIMADQDGNELWSGFLLPEEYSEPYTTGTYYISLTATDGLGRLRGYTFPSRWYNARHSIINVISGALAYTGLALDIYVAPSIVFFDVEDTFETAYISALLWANDNNPASVYDVLDSVLSEMRCTLHQENNRWYVTGVNQKVNPTVSYRVYGPDGVYKNTEGVLVVNGAAARFYGTPVLGISAPFKKVVVTTGVEDDTSFLPEDVVFQKWLKIQEPQDAPPPLHWQGVGIDTQLFPQSGDDYTEYTGDELEQTGVPGFKQIADAEILDHYITLKRDIYVKGGDPKLDFDFVFVFRAYDPDQTFDFYPYVNDNMRYEITLNDVVIISNRDDFAKRNSYLFKQELTIIDGYSESVCTVKVRGFKFVENGYFNIKLYHGGTSIAPPDVSIKITTFNFEYQEPFSNVFTKRRLIDYTTTEELTAFNGDSVFEVAQGAFLYQPLLDESGFVDVPYTSIIDYSSSFPYTNVVRLPESSYNHLNSQPDAIYVKRQYSDYYEFCDDVELYDTGFLYLAKFTFSDGYEMRVQDEIFIRSITGSPQTTEVVNKREQWNLTTNASATPLRLGDAIAKLMHNVYSERVLQVRGVMKGVVQPNMVVLFELKNVLRKFIVVRSDVYLNDNQTDVLLLEYKDDNVNDYG